MSRRPQLIALLEAISHGRRDLSLDWFDAEVVAWAVQTGMGPLFYRAIKENPEHSASPQWHALRAADLTARLLVGNQLEAMEEIVDGCAGRVPPLTLLKGISIGEQYYPEPHLRLMRDLNFLVDRESLPRVKSILQKLGYRQRYDDFLYEGHHHAAPFFHEDKRVWIEVHHALVSPKKGLARSACFSAKTSPIKSAHHSFAAGRFAGLAPNCNWFTSPRTGRRISRRWEPWSRSRMQFIF
jgi:Uncharacterised nucleotidyltransferase